MPVARPRVRRGGLVLDGGEDPTRVALLSQAADGDRASQPVEGSLVELHESILGRSAAAIIDEYHEDHVSVARLTPEGVRAMSAPGTRVAISSAGIRGDSGARYPSFYLFSPAVRAQLEADQARYRELVASRNVLRASPSTTLSTGSFLMSTSLAFDGRDLLPPFFPMFRGQDLLFRGYGACRREAGLWGMLQGAEGDGVRVIGHSRPGPTTRGPDRSGA
jgi:hypothetical protein